MLTDLLISLQPRWWHIIMRLMGLTHQGLKDWAPFPCPCDLGDNEEEYALLESAVVDEDGIPYAAYAI